MTRSTQAAPRGVGVGWRSALASDLLREPGSIDFVEVVAESCAADPRARREALAIAEVWPAVPHGVKLSLGSAEGIEAGRARRLGALARELRAPAVSEHVAFTRAGGRDVGHLTPLPWTREAVGVMARNVAVARRFLPDVPLLLENVAWTFRWPEDAMAEGDFYTEVVRATGCDLLLDVGNLYANSVNSGQSPAEALRTYPLERVGMVHVAGGAVVDGFYEDTHAHPVPEPVFALVEDLFRLVGTRPVLLERDAGFGPFADLAGELSRLRALATARTLAAPQPGRKGARLSVPSDDDDGGSRALSARQAHVAAILTSPSPPAEGDSGPFGVAAIARTRAILLQKRVEEALPLLPRVGARGDAVRDLAMGALAGRPRAPRWAGIADAWRIAEVALSGPDPLSRDARLDVLALRARFRGAAADGSFAPRPEALLGRLRQWINGGVT